MARRPPAGPGSPDHPVEWLYAASARMLRAGTRLLFKPLAGLPRGARLVVLRYGNIGDHLAALPAYRAIRRRFRHGDLTLLTSGGGRPHGVELISRDVPFDHVVDVSAEEFHGFGGISGSVRLMRCLESDGVIHLSSDKARLRILMRDMAVLCLAGVQRCGGFSLGKVLLWRRWQAQNRVFPSETERLLAVLRDVGIHDAPADHRPLRPSVDAPDLPNGSHRWVAMCPGGKFPVNHWPLDRYRTVARELLRDADLGVVVVGGPDDDPAGVRICGDLPAERAVNCAGRLSLHQTAALLADRCRLLISNDTGVGHLGAAVGVPVVSIMSARDFPGCWLPHGSNIGLRHGVHCQVCLRRTCDDVKCIRGIGVSHVLSAARRALGAQRSRMILEV